MSKRQERLPIQVDPFRLAEAGRLMDGDILLSQFKRLQPLLVSDQGRVQVELAFGVDPMGVPNLTGRIRVDLQLICQRCLQPMNWQIDNEVALAFVRHEAEEAAVPGPYEPYLVESVPVYLTDIIEDEVLLALPQIPRHPLAVCPARNMIQEERPDKVESTAVAEHQAKNPFDVLVKLKTPNKVK